MRYDLSNINLEVVGHDEEGNVAVILTPGMVVSLMGCIGHSTEGDRKELLERNINSVNNPNYKGFLEDNNVYFTLAEIYYALNRYVTGIPELRELDDLIST